MAEPGSNYKAPPIEILEYYFKLRGDKRPLNEAKLILVGRGGVGKTSLVNQIKHGIFETDVDPTRIQITPWKFPINGRDEIRLNIWDFGGQAIMHATHQFFLTKNSLYLLVLNGRAGNTDPDAEYWLKVIQNFGENSPVIVVLNKFNQCSFHLNRRTLMADYPSVRCFVETDCADNLGIDELKEVIKRETIGLEHLSYEVPTNWLTIRDRLEAMREDYLTFEDFRKLCEEYGETDRSAQTGLAAQLHHLGVIVNYSSDPRLNDTHVLSPTWVTNGIYRLLLSEQIKKRKGEFFFRELSGILDANQYPKATHSFLVKLMKKFYMCFRLPMNILEVDDDYHISDKKNREITADEDDYDFADADEDDDDHPSSNKCYLIPELLDEQEPVEASKFTPETCLAFEYHYSISPEGLLPRFIVRMRWFSELRWRNGVILNYDGNTALVKADVQNKKVFILIAGPSSGRRQLLAVIRRDFKEIHSYSRCWRPQAMVPVPGYPQLVLKYEDLITYERSNRFVITQVVNGELVDLNVKELLNGIDEPAHRRQHPTEGDGLQVRLFFSYSHKDEQLRDELENHLEILRHRGLLTSWHDRKINAGDDWNRAIDENLETANIILLLVSSDFYASNYCREKEMKRALERHATGEAKVIAVIIRECHWHGSVFADLQVLPKDGKAVAEWTSRDSAWKEVSQGIEKVIKGFKRT